MNQIFRNKKVDYKFMIFIVSAVILLAIFIFNENALASPVTIEPPRLPDTTDSTDINLFNAGWFIVVVIFNTIVGSLVLFLVSLALKVKQSVKQFLISAPIIVAIGVSAFCIGAYMMENLNFSQDLGRAKAFIVSSITIFTVIFVADTFAVKHLGRTNLKQALITGISLGVFTSPLLWFMAIAFIMERI